MAINSESKCAIWPEFQATEMRDAESLIKGTTYYDSPRAGGKYEIADEAKELLTYMDETVEALRIKARLTSWLVEMRRQGVEWPLVTTDVFQQVKVGNDLGESERAYRLLRHFVNITPFSGARLEHGWLQMPTLLCVSESINREEIIYLTRYVEQQSWVEAEFTKTINATILRSVSVTFEGRERVADESQTSNSTQVFIAMWFDPSVARLYDDGIAPAIKQTGYSPYVINRDRSVNKIDDAIIGAIEDSRFVVADFTHGHDGVRGSVYFEAGFAYGRGIPVIHTCREDKIAGLHFDTRQYNHIPWSNPRDLVGELKETILARIGAGPGIR